MSNLMINKLRVVITITPPSMQYESLLRPCEKLDTVDFEFIIFVKPVWPLQVINEVRYRLWTGRRVLHT